MTKKAGAKIGLQVDAYGRQKSMYMADPAKRQELSAKDSLARLALASQEVPETREQILEAAKENTIKSLETGHKLNFLKASLKPELFSQAAQIEQAKTSDLLQIKYGFDLHHLGIAVKHYDML